MPSAVVVTVCAVIYVRARDSIYTQGGQGILSASAGGGVTSTYNSNKNVVVKLCLYRRQGGIRGRWAAGRREKTPKNFLEKTLDIGSNWVYTGCRKRRKGEKRTLGVDKTDTRYCKYYVYWALLFSFEVSVSSSVLSLYAEANIRPR